MVVRPLKTANSPESRSVVMPIFLQAVRSLSVNVVRDQVGSRPFMIEQFIQACPFAITAVVAILAAFAVVKLLPFYVCRQQVQFHEQLRARLILCSAIVANAPHQPLGQDALDRGRDHVITPNVLYPRRYRAGLSLVCSVLKTMCPVNDAWTAIWAVSRSRISPTKILPGFWRRMSRGACANSSRYQD